MYKYRFVVGDYESTRHIVLESKEKFSDKQFEKKINRATKSALEHAVNNPHEFQWSADGKGIEFGSLYKRVLSELESLGFEIPEYECQWMGLLYTNMAGKNYEEAEAATPGMKKLLDSIPLNLRERAVKASERYSESISKDTKAQNKSPKSKKKG